jgi:outer membrane protein assembly factor BamD (BamD/ComL family)
VCGCSILYCITYCIDKEFDTQASVWHTRTRIKGSRKIKKKFTFSRVEAPAWQGAKAPQYQDISSFRNAAGRDASALENVTLFLREPLARSCLSISLPGFQGYRMRIKILQVVHFILLSILITGCATHKKDWEKTKNINTIEAYQSFLSNYPKSRFKIQAKTNLLKLGWEKAKSIHTVDAFQEFLTQHPNSNEARQARAQIDRLSWTTAENINTSESYSDYLLQIKNGIFDAEAKKRIHEFAWTEAQKRDNKDDYKSFIKRHPESTYRTIAEESISWAETLEKNTIQAFEEFIDNYPDSIRSTDAARRHMSNLKWKKIKRSGSRNLYFEYLRKYPNSDYAPDAAIGASIIDHKFIKTNEPQKMGTGLPVSSNMLPNTRVKPEKGYIYLIVTLSIIPVENFILNGDKIHLKDLEGNSIKPQFRDTGGLWLLNGPLESSEHAIKDNKIPNYYFYKNRKKEIACLFTVKKSLIKGSTFYFSNIEFNY